MHSVLIILFLVSLISLYISILITAGYLHVISQHLAEYLALNTHYLDKLSNCNYGKNSLSCTFITVICEWVVTRSSNKLIGRSLERPGPNDLFRARIGGQGQDGLSLVSATQVHPCRPTRFIFASSTPYHILASPALQVLDLSHESLQLLARVLVQLIVSSWVPQVHLSLLTVVFTFLRRQGYRP